MTATFIDGTKIAEDIKAEVAAEVQELHARGIRPGLSVILVGDDAASSAYTGSVNYSALSGNLIPVGSYPITPYGLVEVTSSNYVISYLNGVSQK